MRRRSSCWLLAVLLLAACGTSPPVEPSGHGGSPPATVAHTSQPASHAPEKNRIRGTNRDDVLVGTPGRDVIHGLRGADVIRGAPGDHEPKDNSGVGTGRQVDTTVDAFYGGPGDDVIFASHHDLVDAGPGNDTIYAVYLVPGVVIRCGPGRDVVITNDVYPGIVLKGCEKLRVQYAG